MSAPDPCPSMRLQARFGPAIQAVPPPHLPLQSMMKGMDPEGLAEMMGASGLSVTPEQARSMVDKLDSVSGARSGGAGGAGR